MNREAFAKAQIHFNTMENCERLLVEIGVGNLHTALKKIPKDDLMRYINAGLERDLDDARAELSLAGINLNERV